MEPHENDHGMGRPSVHVPHQHAKGHIELQIFHICIGVLGYGPVIEHQVDTRHHGDEEHEKRESPHAPGKTHPYGMPADLGRMEMEPHITRHHHHTVSGRILITVTEYGPPDLTLNNLFF